MNLLEAAGVGRLDVVKTFFDDAGKRQASATREQMDSGFLYACGYGACDVVEFLLDRGVAPDTQVDRGQTGLHWAMYGPHLDVTDLLIRHAAPVNARDGMGATPLHWALRGWAMADDSGAGRYYDAVTLLVNAGANVDLAHLEADRRLRRVAERVRADARMMTCLRLAG